MKIDLPILPIATCPVPPRFREMLEELADLAVLLLDELDGDVDLEPRLAGSSPNGAAVLDVEGDFADDEPSHGSFDRKLNRADAVAVYEARLHIGTILDRVGARS